MGVVSEHSFLDPYFFLGRGRFTESKGKEERKEDGPKGILCEKTV